MTLRSAFVLLFFAALAVAGCRDEERSVPMLNGVVDAFEDGNLESEQHNAWEAIHEGEGTRAQVTMEAGGFGPDSRGHLQLEGLRPENATGAQVVGLRVSLREAPPAADPARDELASDMSAYDGLAFAMRGTPGSYIVQLGTSQVRDFDYYNAYVEAGQQWQEYRIPFDRFRQEGFGTSYTFAPNLLTHVAFYANQTGYITFGVDDVRFYADGE